MTFTTNAAWPATVVTLTPTNITKNSIMPQGQVTATGDLPISQRGFQYAKNYTGNVSGVNTSTMVTVMIPGSANSSYAGPPITDLTPSTSYSIRAAVINSAGTQSNGSWVTFYTPAN